MSSQTFDENRAKGKKVFFLYPPDLVRNEMLTELIKNEYEVYLLRDMVKAASIFLRYPDSIVLINIDEVLEEPEWEAFIRSLAADQELQNMRIGVLTLHRNEALERKYVDDLQLPCGFVKLSSTLTENTATVMKVLDANGAKGDRRFLRVTCPEGEAKFTFVESDKVINGDVFDISSVGLSLLTSQHVSIQARTQLDNIQLYLKSIHCTVSAIVMGSRADDRGLVYIVLFDKVSAVSRGMIREYLQTTLQANVDRELLHLSDHGKES